MDYNEREAVALFRMSLIGDLIVAGLTSEERTRLLKDKASRIYAIPGSRRTHVAESTLRDWVRLYDRGGLEALMPVFRCDKGSTRTVSTELSDKILALREEDPSRSVQTILTMLRHAGELDKGDHAPASTVYRLLQNRGISKRSRPAPLGKDRRAFAFERPNQCWQSDVMHGPPLREGRTGKARKTYLVTLLDDATRVVVASAFCWSEKLSDFLPVFREALLRRGVPDVLYVDNGAAYKTTHLEVICASLRVVLKHARPYQPQGKGKIERWHRTLRGQWLGSLDLERVMADGGLDGLNARLSAWIEGEYHRTPHHGLPLEGGGYATPLDKWLLHATGLRAAPRDLDECFLVKETRLVRRDRTVHLKGQLFEAPAEYVDRKVEVRYDPAREVLREAYVYERGVRAHVLRPLDLHANAHVRRERNDTNDPQPQPKPTGLNYAELVLERHRDLVTPIFTRDEGDDR